MGSAKVLNSNPQLPMAEYTDKKSIKNILKKPFQALFKDKKKDKPKNEKETVVEKPKLQPPKVTPVSKLLENFQRLEIEKKEKKEEPETEEDEFKNFTVKIVEDDRRSERIDSHSSQDSGFSEKAEAVDTEDEKDKTDKVIESLKDLKIDAKKEDKRHKRLQTVFISRGPIRQKKQSIVSPIPYNLAQPEVDNSFRQINQINRHTFSGGQVIVNSNQNIADNYSEINRAITQIDIKVQNFAHNSQEEQVDYWQIAQEYIKEESTPKPNNNDTQEDILSGFVEVQTGQENYTPISNFVQNDIVTSDPIAEFTNTTHTNFENFDNLELNSIAAYVQDEPVRVNQKTSIFPTPPRSENVPSPMSDSQSFYPSHSDYTLSPEMSSPMYNSDYEKYQDIGQFDDQYPSCVTDSLEESSSVDKPKTRERNASTSSMTMKQFKDLQKELSLSFSKKLCCQINRKTCKEIFQGHIQKLSTEERRSLCLKVANLDLKSAYGVLHHILLSLSKSNKQEDLQCSLFGLICERILASSPALFPGEFGLSLIKCAVFRCYRRPLLTRYLVQCVRSAMRVEVAAAAACAARDSVYHEVDSLGDNVIVACARAGDRCADVLAELVRRDPAELPLFRPHHVNSDGYTALHVACIEHTATSPRLHTVHVLLEHAQLDLWKGDVKGGDTALHLAVNSVHCDLQLIMIMFRHIDRKQWKQLAHVQNRSSVTPLEYARSATKSTTRQNYPHEVLDFLKKCR